MNILILCVTSLIGLLHIFIMGLEMFARPSFQAEIFEMPLDFVNEANAQTALGNQGIYNGMLGLSILLTNFCLPISLAARNAFLMLLMFFILIVGLYGTVTVTKKIFIIQCIPALVALAMLILA